MMATTHTCKTRKRYYVKSRSRFTIFIVLSLLILVGVFTTVFGFNNAEGSTKQKYVQVEVLPGDTLWQIADEYMPADMDPRESVYVICEHNHISASELQAGQVLKIPVNNLQSNKTGINVANYFPKPILYDTTNRKDAPMVPH